jgi:NTP pyrophosphatase (non-canonical NTP hydrolase)
MKEIVDRVHQNSVNKGFWDGLDPNDPRAVMTKLALITSEIGEAVEAVRDGNDEGLREELADITIRTMDLARAKGFDHEQDVLAKAAKNESRPYQHGRKVGI